MRKEGKKEAGRRCEMMDEVKMGEKINIRNEHPESRKYKTKVRIIVNVI